MNQSKITTIQSKICRINKFSNKKKLAEQSTNFDYNLLQQFAYALRKASAPPTISSISFVIDACLALLY